MDQIQPARGARVIWDEIATRIAMMEEFATVGKRVPKLDAMEKYKGKAR